MTSLIERLAASRGNAADVVGMPPSSGGMLDLSADDWGGKAALIRNVILERCVLRNTAILADFVDCEFRNCEFEDLTAKQHFWGGGDTWSDCAFRRIELSEAFSPRNRFVECRFEDVTLRGYEPFETVFTRCHFRRLTLDGFRAARVPSRPTAKELQGTTAVVLFESCEFDEPSLRKCSFDRVEFRGCRISRPQVDGCDFAGAIADQRWWPDQTRAPFAVFLDEVLSLIGRRVGTASASYVKWMSYRNDYLAGRTTDMDFSKYLYEKVPDEELDQYEDDLLTLANESAL